MGHNFYVEWHFKFEVEKGEKAWSMPVVTIHQPRKVPSWPAVYAKSVKENPCDPL
jgi:hypothetical protein